MAHGEFNESFALSFRIKKNTYNFCKTFTFGNVPGPILTIIFRLKFKTCRLCKARNATIAISRISLFDKSKIRNEIKPRKTGIRCNLFPFNFNSERISKFFMFSSHCSAVKSFCGSSLYLDERKKFRTYFNQTPQKDSVFFFVAFFLIRSREFRIKVLEKNPKEFNRIYG